MFPEIKIFCFQGYISLVIPVVEEFIYKLYESLFNSNFPNDFPTLKPAR